MFLSNDYVHFYHPLDDLIEHTKNLTWTAYYGNVCFVPSILTSGISISGDQLEYGGTPAYSSLASDTSATVAAWVSGIFKDNTNTVYFKVGYGSVGGIIRNGVGFAKYDTYARTLFSAYNGHTDQPLPSMPDADTDWHLIVVDVRYSGGGYWRHRISIDGDPWIDCGLDYNGHTSFDTTTAPKIYFLPWDTSVIFDEAILWGGNELFTDEELANLYNLYHTHNATMDQYGSIFGNPASSGTDCFIHSHAQASGNIELYIPSQQESKLIGLFTEGSVQISDNVNLYISGTPPIISSFIDLYMCVPSPASGNVDLYISGPLLVNNNINNFIFGHQVLNNNIDQYTYGYSAISGNIDLCISGVPATSSSIDTYIAGPIPVSDDFDNHITGHLPISGFFDLFIKSGRDLDAFALVVNNNPSNDLDLFMYGTIPVGPTISHANNRIKLFINDDGEDTRVGAVWPSFVRVADAIPTPYGTTWQSLVRCSNTINNNISLFINSHASGESPYGISVINQSTIFIDGRGSQEGDEGLLFDGYYLYSSEFAGFANVHMGLSGIINLYSSGLISVVQYSTNLNLSIFGILGIGSGSCYSYTDGHQFINHNCNLFMFGVDGVASGNISLYLDVTNIGLLNKTGKLYAHGF